MLAIARRLLLASPGLCKKGLAGPGTANGPPRPESKKRAARTSPLTRPRDRGRGEGPSAQAIASQEPRAGAARKKKLARWLCGKAGDTDPHSLPPSNHLTGLSRNGLLNDLPTYFTLLRLYTLTHTHTP